jgi:hypothetical protein
MSVSTHLFKSIRVTNIFWNVFANFAQLGDLARLYLLKTRMMGRLIDIHLNTPPDVYFAQEDLVRFQNKFRDSTLRGDVPLIVYTKDLYIGIDPERSVCVRTPSEKK